MMQRNSFQNGGLTLSYLDVGGEAPVLLALHAHLMEAVTYEALAAAVAPHWRVIALDQRGHGYSSHAGSYTRLDYLGDIEALLTHLHVGQAALLGNSLGGVNAYQFAAGWPDRVIALIVEDIGAIVADDISFILPWEGVFPTREELEARIGQRFVPYLRDSFRHDAEGWSLAFHPREMLLSQQQLIGDHWKDWLASTCPALILRGRESRVTTQEHVDQMAQRRRNCQVVTLDGGHALHVDNPAEFNAEVSRFLELLQTC
jgi:pimeloyl-ACP methyl ester carboxylesterase